MEYVVVARVEFLWQATESNDWRARYKQVLKVAGKILIHKLNFKFVVICAG